MDDSSETSDGFGATPLVPARVRSLLVPTPKSRLSESSSLSRHDWNTVVMNAFASSHSIHSTLAYPWERGTVSGVFSDRLLPSLPSAAPSIGFDLSADAWTHLQCQLMILIFVNGWLAFYCFCEEHSRPRIF